MRSFKKLVTMLVLLASINTIAQNVGINNVNPQAALDLQGDLRLRSAVLTLPTGLNHNVDLVSTKSSVYMFGGGALALGGCQITGFTGGVDGRMVTIFNNSTNGAVQLYDASNGISIANSAVGNRILTGTGNSAIIYGNGSVTLRYDGAKASWVVSGSNYVDGLSTATTTQWNVAGNNISNNNTGNVGIGESNPAEKLQVNNGNAKIGGTVWNSAADDRILKFGDVNYVTIGEVGGDDKMEIKANDITLKAVSGNVLIPTGNIGIGINNPIAPISFANVFGNRISLWTNTPTTQYGIGIQSGTFQFYTPGSDKMAFGYGSSSNFTETMSFFPGSGQLGIGTLNPGAYKLAVNGNIRSKEVVVETGWADFVFANDYQLRSLKDVEQFIKINNHLPDVPSAKEIQTNGLKVGEVQTKMMQKIEELTLYVIELKKEIELLKEKKDVSVTK